MAEFIDDRKEYKKILRDIHIEKIRKNMKEYMIIFNENKKKTDSKKNLLGSYNKIDLKQYLYIYIR